MTQKIEQLEMAGISKSFHGIPANRNIDFTIGSGEILGLLGENGAGKTTLMNILYGLYQPDSGEIRINGAPVRIRSPLESINSLPQRPCLIVQSRAIHSRPPLTMGVGH